jgi:hypothetical protein
MDIIKNIIQAIKTAHRDRKAPKLVKAQTKEGSYLSDVQAGITLIRNDIVKDHHVCAPTITIKESYKSMVLITINHLYPIDFKRKIVFYIVKILL